MSCDFEPGTEYYECCNVCAPIDQQPRGLSRPCVAPHLSNSKLFCAFEEYQKLPFAAYPPGSAPTGGDPELRISSVEMARRVKSSKCYQCQTKVDIKRAARLTVDWRFWVGCGLLGLAGTTLLITRK